MNETINNQIKNIDATEWAQVLSLFDELSVLSTEELASRLHTVKLSDSAKELLHNMLTVQHQPNLLDQTINPLVEALMGPEAVKQHFNPADIIGRTFGPWKATETLGVGGMGQVFVAERADGQFEKQVALKIIKSGHFSELSQQRFLAEMRTLAQFEHPNIAHLIDGGTNEEGIVYFIMELVGGEPIVDYAKAKNLSLSQRIELVLQVIDAVEYAHQSLIIHGDIKPANILVNHSGQVKLVDFGIARPLDDERLDNYLPQFTPSYSAPEQAQGKALTTASDVFGLCAVLYELCTGSSPRSNESTTTHAKFTQTVNTPITPAIANFKSNQSDEKINASYAKNKAFSQALSKELGTIIDKGLQIAVADRYKNTTELRRDLVLFLEGSAVPSFANNKVYKWRKLFGKHKLIVVISSLALIGVLTTTMLAVIQARHANIEAEKAKWSSDFLLSVFDQADPVKNQQNPITVNELTNLASEQLLQDDSNFVPSVRLNALSLLGNIQYKLGQAESASKIHLKQIGLLKQHSSDADSLAQAHFDLAMDYQQLGMFDQALVHFNQAGEVIPIDEKVTHMGVTALQSVVMINVRFNKLKEAEIIINKLLSIEDEILKADKPFLSMANVSMAHARFAQANENYEQALKAIEKNKFYFQKIPYDPIFYAEIMGTESSIYANLRRYGLAVKAGQEAIEIFKQHYGLNHPETMIALSNHASLLGKSGYHERSIESYLEVLEIIKNVPVPDFFAPIMNQNLAHQFRKTEQCNLAINYFEKTESMWATLENRRPLGEVNTFSGMARCYLMLGELQLSETYFNQALQLAKEIYGVEHSLYARTQLMSVSLLLEQNKISELNEMMPQLYQTLFDKYGSQSTWVASAALKWAKLYEKQDDFENTHQMAQQALEIYEKSQPISSFVKLIDEAKKLIES